MTREELWLAAIAGLEGAVPPDYPVWHYEDMLAAIYDAVTGSASPRAFPARSWKLDEFLYAVYCVAAGLDDPGCPEPTDRIELFWKGIYDGVKGEAGASVPTPVWRIEEFLSACFDASSGLGERTLTGSIVSFIGRANTEILSITAAVTPVQDLHGYDHPWAAGAGNNKAYWPTLTNSSSSNVDYTILDDGNTLHVEGTASANSMPWAASLSNTYANMPLGPYPAGDYTIIANGLVGQNTNDRIAFTARYADNSSVSGGSGRISGPTSTIPNGTGAASTFTATDEFKIGFYMVISSGTSVNCDVRIQLEKASSVGSWEPYANICPITGFMGASITRTGKNLFDEANATVYKRYMNASDKWMGDANSSSYAFPCKPDTDYVVTANNENLTIFRVGYANVETLANGIQLYNVTRLTSAGTIQIHTGADATYIIVQCNVAIVDAKNAQLQIEYGTTASAYEAYTGNTYTVDWTSTAGTVYAGTYDAVSGKLKARPQYDSYNGETLVGPWLSSMNVYAAGTTPTTGAQVVDLGGTETEYTLTPQTVSVLVGQNNVWTDTGDVTVKVKWAVVP